MKFERMLSMLRVILAIILPLSVLNAEKQPLTGTIKDGVYHDSRFGFSVKIPAGWREAKLRKEISPERLIIVQRKPAVPLRLQDYPESAVKPTVMIFADSCTMSPDSFLAYVRADTGSNEFKDKIISKSVFLERGTPSDIEILDRSQVKVGGRDALQLKLRRLYTARVKSPGFDTPAQVRDYRTGYIYIVPSSGWLMYIEQVCENEYRETLADDFGFVISSIAFDSTTVK